MKAKGLFEEDFFILVLDILTAWLRFPAPPMPGPGQSRRLSGSFAFFLFWPPQGAALGSAISGRTACILPVSPLAYTDLSISHQQEGVGCQALEAASLLRLSGHL